MGYIRKFGGTVYLVAVFASPSVGFMCKLCVYCIGCNRNWGLGMDCGRCYLPRSSTAGKCNSAVDRL